MKTTKHIILIVIGWVLVAVALFLIVIGVLMGAQGDSEFYQRQDDYHALDYARDEMMNRVDSLYNLMTLFEQQGDTIAAASVRADIQTIEDSADYADLFGIPAPPQGFSMSYLITILMCLVALIPLFLGIAFLVVGYIIRHNYKTKTSTMII